MSTVRESGGSTFSLIFRIVLIKTLATGTSAVGDRKMPMFVRLFILGIVVVALMPFSLLGIEANDLLPPENGECARRIAANERARIADPFKPTGRYPIEFGTLNERILRVLEEQHLPSRKTVPSPFEYATFLD